MATGVPHPAAAQTAGVPPPVVCADRLREGAIRYSTLLRGQNRVSRTATAGLDETYGQFLEALNTEARAAIESERLLAHLMAWRDAPGAKDPGARRVIASIPSEGPRVAAARRDMPRLGEVSPVTQTAFQRLVRMVDRVQSPLHPGRIDVLG